MRHSFTRVLIPSDNRDIVYCLAEAYGRAGLDVVLGTSNFELDRCGADLLHFMWPEELTEWQPPAEAKLDAIDHHLARWASKARIIGTVNNLYPHGHHGNPRYRRLFLSFYRRAEVLHHVSRTSHRLVCEAFPEVALQNHLVRLGFNYDRLLAMESHDRATTRAHLGIAPDEVLFIALGAIRSWDEADILMKGFSGAKAPAKRLLMAARLRGASNPVRRRLQRWRLEAWKRGNRIVGSDEFLPNERMAEYLRAADAAIVVRPQSMASGIPPLAMTFGLMVVCPNSGSMPEFVSGAPNPMYESSSADSLARAIEAAASSDFRAVGASNRKIASEWSWDGIVEACLGALPAAPA